MTKLSILALFGAYIFDKACSDGCIGYCCQYLGLLPHLNTAWLLVNQLDW